MERPSLAYGETDAIRVGRAEAKACWLDNDYSQHPDAIRVGRAEAKIHILSPH